MWFGVVVMSLLTVYVLLSRVLHDPDGCRVCQERRAEWDALHEWDHQ
jgi:hypothetical protein